MSERTTQEEPTLFESEILDRIRFPPEEDLLVDTVNRFRLGHVLRHVMAGTEWRREVREARLRRASSLRLDATTAPDIHRILQETMERLELPVEVELYLENTTEVNASAHWSADHNAPWCLSVSSGAIERFSPEELRFLFGHELAHHYYAHTVSSDIRFAFRTGEWPRLLSEQLRVWQRLAEFSADRAGLAATGNRLDVAVACLFKIMCGLGPQHLSFDLNALLEQAEKIAEVDSPDLLGERTHPLIPLRARALYLHHRSLRDKLGGVQLGALEQEVLRIARLMDLEARSEQAIHARDFLVAGGLLVAHADGDTTLPDYKRNLLIDLISPFTDDPEGHLRVIRTREDAEVMLRRSVTWIGENLGEERYELFALLIDLVAATGIIDEGERVLLISLAEGLAIPPRVVEDFLRKALAASVYSAAAPDPEPFGLEG